MALKQRRRPSGMQALIGFAAMVIAVAGLRAAAPVAVPVLLAAFISILCVPPLYWLTHRGIPSWLALTIVLTFLTVLTLALPLFVGGSLRHLLEDLPRYQLRLVELEGDTASWLQSMGLNVTRQEIRDYVDTRSLTGLVGGLLNGMIRGVGNAFLILIMVAFMLTEGIRFPIKLQTVLGSGRDAPELVTLIVNNIRRYVAIKTWISLGTGALIAVVLKILRVEYAEFWGLLAFVFNYVPTIGCVLAGIPAVVLALVDRGPATAACAVVAYVVINQVLGSVIEPRWQGQGLGLSTLVVFVSLLFWGWVLGPVGALLSAPLTMIVRIVLESYPDSKWIATLLAR